MPQPRILHFPSPRRSPSGIRFELIGSLYLPSGTLIKTLPPVPAQSLLAQFYGCLYIQAAQTTQAIRDTGNTLRTISAGSSTFICNAAVNVSTNGLLIGTGSTPVDETDYKLESQVATNVAHSAHAYVNESFGTNGWRFSITRTFTNNTGATVEIAEVAWYAYTAGYFFCLDRSLYPISLLDAKIFALTYRFSSGA